MGDPRSGHLPTIEETCAALDAVGEYGILQGESSGLVVLHGAAMYARDTARAASELLIAGHTLAASALICIVIEHAVLTQWVKADPEARGQLFLQQSKVERQRWIDVALATKLDMSDPAHGPKLKNVAEEFNTPKNLFGDTDNGRQLYLTYRNLSRFVHPSAPTLGQYMGQWQHGPFLSPRLQHDQNAEAVGYYLASALTMCALPYFDVLEDAADVAASLRAIARAAGVDTALE